MKYRSIAVDRESNVWIATASGVFKKEAGTKEWEEIISGEERGPAYSVVVNSQGDILIGTWNGLYRYRDKMLVKEEGPEPPVSEICSDNEGDYALGPLASGGTSTINGKNRIIILPVQFVTL